MGPLLKIESRDNGRRLDVVLARAYPKYSRAFLQKVMRGGGVALVPSAGPAGASLAPSYRVRAGQTFEIADFDIKLSSFRQAVSRNPGTFETSPDPGFRRGDDWVGTIVPTVLYEDEALLVLDKPAGLVVHPAPGHRAGTLLDWLRGYLPPAAARAFDDPERLGLVHRLDKETSGVILVAKSVVAQTDIGRQFRERAVEKTYAAFVEGVPRTKRGVVSAPVGRSRKAPLRMAISGSGRPSETAFEVKESWTEVSLVNVHPKTGRTHQIRVHMAAVGHPLVGDRTYGADPERARVFGVQRPLLHAERLKLAHPLTGKPVVFEAPWPDDFRQARKRFRNLQSAMLIALSMGLGLAPARAQEGSSAAPHAAPTGHRTSRAKTGTGTSQTSARISELNSKVGRLQQDMAALQESLNGVSKEVDGLSKVLSDLDGSKRLRDLERAISDMNSRAVGNSAAAEEVKTQVLDLERRIRSQQDAVSSLRDQMDRLQRQVIQRKAVEAETPRSDMPSPGSGGPP